MLTRLLAQLRGRWRRRAIEAESGDELDLHIQLETDANIARGLSPGDARRTALAALGGRTQMHEAVQQVHAWPWQSWLDDVFFSVRRAIRRPGFIIAASLVLALGVGPVTALFTMMNATFMRPWQVPDPDKVVMIRAKPAADQVFGSLSIAEARYLHAHSRTVLQMGGWISAIAQVSRTSGDATFKVPAARVSADYFDTLRIGMTAGRFFSPDEEISVLPPSVVVISESLWRDHLDADQTLVGHTIRIDGSALTVIGIAARGFADVQQGSARTDLWLPFSGQVPDTHVTVLAGRLADGVSISAAQSELSVLSRDYRDSIHMSSGGILLTDTRPGLSPAARQWSIITLISLALGLVLVLACANVGNLLLFRASRRRREMAICLSLGASRARLIRQLMMDSSLIAATAGVLGLAIAYALPRVVIAMAADRATRVDYFDPDLRVFAFAFGVLVFTTVVTGLAPALRGTRITLAGSAGDRHGPTVQGTRLRTLLLAGQVAVAAILLVGAGLLTRAIGHALSMEPGFATESVEAIAVKLPVVSPMTRREDLFRALEKALVQTDLPPIAYSDFEPLTDTHVVMFVRRPGEPPGSTRPIKVLPVSPNYFHVMGIGIVSGRLPVDRRREIIVSQAAAHELWPNRDAVGQTLLDATKDETKEVVGVARDVPTVSLADDRPVIYSGSSYVLETLLVASHSTAVVDQVRSLASRIDKDVVVTSRPAKDFVRASLQPAVIGSRVAWGIGGLALALALAGAFGVFSHAVEERRREIGVRMALGAQTSQVVGLVFRATQTPVIAGLTAGLVVALIASPLLRRSLFGLSPFDPLAYAEIAVVLIMASGLATWIPVCRAARVNPATTLKVE